MLRGVLPFAAENDIVEPFLIFVKCSKIILKQINVVRALAKSGGFCYTVSSLLGCGNAREGERMEQTNKGLSGNQLKLFAMLAMTVDHFTSVIWPDYPRDWWILLLHIIGRIAAPIFWFMVAEGYHYTRNLKKVRRTVADFSPSSGTLPTILPSAFPLSRSKPAYSTRPA